MKRPNILVSNSPLVSNGMETNSNKKIRVMFVLPGLLPGGIEKHTIQLLKHFDRTKFDLSLATLFTVPNRPTLYDEVPKDVRVNKLSFKSSWSPSGWGALREVFNTARPDIVISSMFSCNTIVRLLKPAFGYRVITREHNIYSEKNIFQRFVDMTLAPLSDETVAVSKSVADFFSKHSWVRRNRITVIHNGVDIEAITRFIHERGEEEKRRVRAEIGLKDDEKIILNVARLKPQKNHELLIGAFRLFVKENPHYHLVVIGDGVERARLEKLIETYDLRKSVRLLGYRNDVFSWYAASDFFVLTSRFEGFPNVGVEAMAFGLPMVSTHVPGVDEFLISGENGQSVDATPQSVVAGMVAITSLSSSERTAYMQQCLITAAQFDINRITKKYESLCNAVL